MRPAKTQISLGIRPVWSETSLSTWRKLGSLAGRMPRLIWAFAGRTVILLVLSRGGSNLFLWVLLHYDQLWVWSHKTNFSFVWDMGRRRHDTKLYLSTIYCPLFRFQTRHICIMEFCLAIEQAYLYHPRNRHKCLSMHGRFSVNIQLLINCVKCLNKRTMQHH